MMILRDRLYSLFVIAERMEKSLYMKKIWNADIDEDDIDVIKL